MALEPSHNLSLALTKGSANADPPPLGEVEIVRWWDLDERDAMAWRRLALTRSNPFAGPDWVAACVEGKVASDPVVLVARDVARQAVGFLALEHDRMGPFRALRLPGNRLGDWYEPACDPRIETSFVAACSRALELLDWQVLELDRWTSGVGAGCGDHIGVWSKGDPDVLPFIEFGSGGWEGYLASRSRNFRSQLGRRRRKLEREEGLEFRLAGPQTLADDWEAFARLHDARWKTRGGRSVLAGPGRAVHSAFARLALERGWLRLWIMLVGGRVSGAWLGWRFGERYGYQLSGFDPGMSREGIGVVLLAHTIEQAAAEGARIYDLMWGDEPYKSRFETGQRTAGSWALARRGSLAAASLRGRIRARGAARRLPERIRRFAR